MTVEDVLGTMGIKMETVTRAVDAVQAMMSAAAQAIITNLQALEPVFTLVAAVMGAAFLCGPAGDRRRGQRGAEFHQRPQ
jgi:hypothetical protein